MDDKTRHHETTSLHCKLQFILLRTAYTKPIYNDYSTYQALAQYSSQTLAPTTQIGNQEKAVTNNIIQIRRTM